MSEWAIIGLCALAVWVGIVFFVWLMVRINKGEE